MTPFTNFCTTFEESTRGFITTVWEYGQNVPTVYWVLFALLSGMAFVHFRKQKKETKKNKDRESLSKRFTKLKSLIYYRVFNGVHAHNKEKRNKGLENDVLVNTSNAKKLVNKMKKKEQPSSASSSSSS